MLVLGQKRPSEAVVGKASVEKHGQIEIEHLLAALEHHSAQLQTAAEISRAISGLLDPDELIRRVVDLVRDRFDLHYVGLFLVDQTGEWGCDQNGQPEPGRWAVLRAGTGEAGQQMLEKRHKLEVSDTSMIGWCIAHKQTRIARDVGEDPVRFNNPFLPEARFELALPLISRGEAIGAMTIQCTQPAAFSDEDVTVLQTMVDQLAYAITNARLYRHTHREIIERKRAEEKLRQYAAELEARNEELDAFAHTVAHDLREPLSLIVFGIAVVLEGKTPNNNTQDHLKLISQAAHRMRNIISELLLLASVRKAEVTIGPLDMVNIVAEAQQRLAYMIEEHEAEIVLPKSWPVALGHGPWVEEVWTNYLSNAIKYGGQPPRMELGAEVLPPSVPLAGGEGREGTVRFWIRDNGPALTPEEQARLFTPFTRLDQACAKGHGLGLSIVRRIVEKLGGQVGVESEVGQGSTFSFTLPASDQDLL
jgi:signal transduction histidine kinase